MPAVLETPTSERSRSKPWAVKNLPPFPRIAVELLELLSHEDVAIKKIVDLIHLDPAFAAEVLRLANSAVYGFHARIGELDRALVLLGAERVKALSMTVALRKYGNCNRQSEAIHACWRHSLGCAAAGVELARAFELDSDHAYTAGLLHDVGRLGLLVGFPEQYATLLAVTVEHGFDPMEVERAMFDLDHCEAGMWLAKDWNFPGVLCEVIGEHHRKPEDRGRSTEPTGYAVLVHFACRLADSLGYIAAPPRQPESVAEVLADLPEPVRGRFRLDPERLDETVRWRVAAIGD
ncbi:MAG: HDOD domain-containing protein [Bryobacteraceae bacterium]